MTTKQRFYFDTSVFGGVYDEEFEESSIQLFEKVRLGQIVCLYSALTEGELSLAPQNVRSFFEEMPIGYLEKVMISDEAVDLANNTLPGK